jgi:hypothetical protein
MEINTLRNFIQAMGESSQPSLMGLFRPVNLKTLRQRKKAIKAEIVVASDSFTHSNTRLIGRYPSVVLI